MFELLKSKLLLGILIGLGAFIVLLGIFTAGIHVGQRKAFHAVGWSENYSRLLGRPPRGLPTDRLLPPPPNMGGGHGAFGRIVSLADRLLVVQGKDNVEQSVLVTSSTVVRVGREAGSLEQLRSDMDVAVFGVPTIEGQIEARLIRVFEKP